MQPNYNFEDKESVGYLSRQVWMGRYALLLIVILTTVNLALLVFGGGRYFVFSASVPYYLTLMGRVMDNGYVGSWDTVGSFTVTALIISGAIVLVYLLAYLFSDKRPGWLTVGFVLFAIDTLGMLFFSFAVLPGFFGVIDYFIHAWALYSLFSGMRNGKHLAQLRKEAEENQ